ncbi:hypothetical protein RM530_03165 [Algiphilus sp. W345]|uniref:Uncharacterized protein n=1 Tax=Banduia mediterranea TaxID=3075609 RepID=A0ABU2WER7_9GAMM|nr:hypothetical protein [Algiphilus sp. W345]MDT0496368.1 hypothetical protein [Algiphilus sp. W345]
MSNRLNAELIFKNELLVKLNQICRLDGGLHKGRFPSAVVYTKSPGFFINVFYSFLLRVASAFSFLILFCFRVPSGSNPESAFIYVDRRRLKFSEGDCPAYNIGLYKYFSVFREDHVYQLLSLREVLRCLVDAFSRRRLMAEDIMRMRGITQFSGKQLLALSGFSYLRCLDLLLAKTALSKFQRIKCAGHFDVYTALMSQLRQDGSIKNFSGIQHGLFENFWFGEPAPLFFDEYKLLFPESRRYFEQRLSANPNCVFHVREKMPIFEHCAAIGITVGVALQTDDEASDARLLDALQVIARGRFSLLAYAHPAAPAKGLAKLHVRFPDIRFERKLRCSNVAVVITRYSTLAMEYVAAGVPAIFWAAPDRVCVSFSGHPLIHEITELDMLPEVLNTILPPS